MKTNKDDYIGQKFGKLTINEVKNIDDYGHTSFICQCDCGNKTQARLSDLKRGHVKSCGCLIKERRKSFDMKQNYFGLYIIWEKIKRSVIPIDKEWKNSFISFRNWCIQRGYRNNFDLIRIDKKRGFFPDNCKWGIHEKYKNCTTFYYKDKYWSLSDLADKFDIKKNTLYDRLIKRKLPIENVIMTSVRKYNKKMY